MSGKAKWWQDPSLCAYCGKPTGKGVEATKDKAEQTCWKWKCSECGWQNTTYPPRVEPAKPRARRRTEAARHWR